MGVPSTAWRHRAAAVASSRPPSEPRPGRPSPDELPRYWTALAPPASRIAPLGPPWDALALGAAPLPASMTHAHGNAKVGCGRVLPDEADLVRLKAAVGSGHGSKRGELARCIGVNPNSLASRLKRRHNWPEAEWDQAMGWLRQQGVRP